MSVTEHLAPVDEPATELGDLQDAERVLDEGCLRLIEEGRNLRRLRVHDVARGIEAAARRWLEPSEPRRREVVARVVHATGMAREVVEHGLDVELGNYTAKALMAALVSEIRDPTFLDGFRPRDVPGAQSRARGPALIAYWFSATIPALPALSIARGLLLKSPAVARLSSREQAFAPAFVATLGEHLDGVERAVWLTTWPPERDDCLETLARRCDAAIVYGGPETCERLRSVLAPHLQFVEHGHKVGLGLISRSGLAADPVADLAANCAWDIATFDQRGCISPQIYLVEKDGPVSPIEFAEALAGAMRWVERSLPASTIGIDELVATSLELQEVRYRGGRPIRAGSGWVLVEPRVADAVPTVGRRVVRVVPVDDLATALEELPSRRHLQNVSLRAQPEERGRILEILTELGASRICRPGRMAFPTVMWHHDGLECLGRLVRWTDLEM